MPADLDSIKETLSNLTVQELNDLRKQLEEHWDVKAAAGGMIMAAPASGADAAGEETTQKTEAKVVLKTVPADKKMNIIRTIRQLVPSLSITEAKTLADSAPSTIKENVPIVEAEEMKKKFIENGATVDLE